ncbi:TPA: nucleoside triphosphate pyrophosphohydrolase ham1 [Trebouxia sp. C0005]
MGGPIDKSRKAIKKEQHDSSPPVAEFEGPQSHLGAGAGKGVLGTHVPLLKEQQETEAERGHPVKLEVHPAQAANKRPRAGQPGSSVPPEDVHTVEEGGREVKLPLEVGTFMECEWKQGQYHRAKVIERRKRSDAPDYEYYVHYINFNRRMDAWTTLDHVDLATVATSEAELSAVVTESGGRTRNQKRKIEDVHEEEEHHGEFDQNALREHEEFTKVKNVERIELGRYEMETWYFSPLPQEYNMCKMLYFCEYDLMFFKERQQMLQHLKRSRIQHPPGDEIYRNANVSMFEIDGKKEKLFCQNLCYLAKLFLDHKTLFYDVDLFLFYVLCECDERGAHVVGYFSKEKSSEDGYNLACILTLPPYQRKGYGKFLISISYELSKIENKVGTPERPLSDLGLVSYRGYWTRELLKVLKDYQGTISLKELSEMTAIKVEDVVSTLQHLNLIQYQKGQHVICAARKLIERNLKEAGSAGLAVDPSKIVWTPYHAEREYANYRG